MIQNLTMLSAPTGTSIFAPMLTVKNTQTYMYTLSEFVGSHCFKDNMPICRVAEVGAINEESDISK